MSNLSCLYSTDNHHNYYDQETTHANHREPPNASIPNRCNNGTHYNSNEYHYSTTGNRFFAKDSFWCGGTYPFSNKSLQDNTRKYHCNSTNTKHDHNPTINHLKSMETHRAVCNLNQTVAFPQQLLYLETSNKIEFHTLMWRQE